MKLAIFRPLFVAASIFAVVGFAAGFSLERGLAYTMGYMEGYERGFRVATGTPDDRPLPLDRDQEAAYREWAKCQ